MLFKGTGIIVGLVASFILCGGYMLDSSVARDTAFKAALNPPESTLALAPLSLGNPFAAKGPETNSIRCSKASILPVTAAILYAKIFRVTLVTHELRLDIP